jgi:hypothetical protein
VRHRRDARRIAPAANAVKLNRTTFSAAIAQVPETELRAGAVNARSRAPDRARSARSAEALTASSTAPESCVVMARVHSRPSTYSGSARPSRRLRDAWEFAALRCTRTR